MRNAPTAPVPAARPVVAAYLRISKDDGARGESNSIKTQREMVYRHIAAQEDLRGAEIVDYVDDGLSGETTGREAYQRLMGDVQKGRVQTICCKDLLRIGRSLIDVDDLLMNCLIAMRVRFIAINNGYDSLKHPLSNLELAIINLANQHYNRDLALKSISARNVKSRRGEWLGMPPLGYKKSDTERNRLVIDGEAAEYVRYIFSLAVGGKRCVEICKTLNAEGIPSPSVYKTRNGHKNMWANVIDPDYCFWAPCVIHRILRNEAYIGKAVANKFHTDPVTKRFMTRPQSDWIIVPNAHEPIVGEEVFYAAHKVLPRARSEATSGNVFGNKIKCPSCGHAMTRQSAKGNPTFKCGTAKLTDHYGCQVRPVLQSRIEQVILSSLRVYAAALIEREELKLTAAERNVKDKSVAEGKLKAEERALRKLEESITKDFTAFVAGKMAKECFAEKNEAASAAIAERAANIERLREELSDLSAGKGEVEGRLAELRPLLTIERLDKALVDMLIDKIVIRGEREIEVVWSGRLR